MNKLFQILIFLSIALSLSAQKYYYYAGNKIMLPITDSIVVYTCSNLSDREKMCGAGAQKLIIHKDDASKIHNNEVTSKEYVIVDDSVSVRMSNHFYIKESQGQDK